MQKYRTFEVSKQYNEPQIRNPFPSALLMFSAADEVASPSCHALRIRLPIQKK